MIPDSSVPAEVAEHPIFKGGNFGLMTADKPKHEASDKGGNASLEAHLNKLGLKHEKVIGNYEGPEQSYIVHKPTRGQMIELGKKFGQESVIYSQGGRHQMIFINGPHKDHYVQTQEPHISYFAERPNDYFTAVPNGPGFFRMGFNFDDLFPLEVHKSELGEGKRFPGNYDWPDMPRWAGSYEWHDGNTRHYLRKAEPGPHPHMDAPPKPATSPIPNEQAAPVGISTYHQYAQHYGEVNPAKPTNLRHYAMSGTGPRVDNMVRQHGYKVYYAGGKYGKPDLMSRNYNTRHLMIYDPSPEAGATFGDGDYTANWRKLHELAHALTYQQLNLMYGEGRRIGKLGHHRTTREAKRAVHWEYLAAHKQRELAKQLGVEISDEDFNKELNTVMHDAVHRAATGQFTEPSQEGFSPHGHKVPLETSFGLIDQAAKNLGLQHQDALISKLVFP